MPLDAPDFRHRAQLTELIDEPCSREELRACLRDLAKVNRWLLGYRPVLDWLDEFAAEPIAGPLRILDAGCGYGDGLRRIEKWAGARGLAVELAGLDANPDAVAIAKDASPATSKIEWVCADVLSYAPPKPAHLIVSSLVTHHFGEADVVRFLEWLERHAELGWFINDLSRAAVPYHLFRVFAKVARLHPFVQHDGPVSIARAFVPEDWRRMCAAAGLGIGDVSIREFAPARLCVGRRKQR
jgi:SAM-dependent methyltransferase